MAVPAELTEEIFIQALGVLADRDPDLARILKDLGPPPMWAREPGFPTLLHIILEQQVSLASAQATYDRLLVAVAPLTPERFLTLDDAALKAIGFSRQKTVYGRHLAQAIVEGRLNLTALAALDDATVRTELLQLKGIGPWTADIYLLMALRRPDVWPTGDLALAVAVQGVKRLDLRPKPDELDAIGDAWRPWRAVAARLLWHYYLSDRGSG
jgi:DNA-3-methyladenine glycosylase II